MHILSLSGCRKIGVFTMLLVPRPYSLLIYVCALVEKARDLERQLHICQLRVLLEYQEMRRSALNIFRLKEGA